MLQVARQQVSSAHCVLESLVPDEKRRQKRKIQTPEVRRVKFTAFVLDYLTNTDGPVTQKKVSVCHSLQRCITFYGRQQGPKSNTGRQQVTLRDISATCLSNTHGADSMQPRVDVLGDPKKWMIEHQWC